MQFLKKIIEKIYLSMKDNLVYYDSVTSCRTRYYFDNVVKKKYKNTECCIIFIDIDNLKQINDTKGHAYGTEIIRNVGHALLNIDGVHDVCRIGGDEFILICDIDVKACNYLSSICHITYGCYKKHMYESIDVAVNKADKAMYINKKLNKDNTISQ